MAHAEVWEVASMLGVGWETQDPRTAGAPSSSSSLDLIRRRVAHAQGEGPAPEARAPTPDEMAMMQEAFGT